MEGVRYFLVSLPDVLPGVRIANVLNDVIRHGSIIREEDVRNRCIIRDADKRKRNNKQPLLRALMPQRTVES